MRSTVPDRQDISRETPSLVWELVDLERYEVRRGDAVLGYIEVVAPVFVVYLGCRFAKAVEIAQLHSFDGAVERLSAASAVAYAHESSAP